MPSTTRRSMKIKHPRPPKTVPDEQPEITEDSKVEAPKANTKAEEKVDKKPAPKKPSKVRKKSTSTSRAKKKPATSKKASTPADAILQSNAVEPDIEKASKPKKTKKSPTKKTSTKKTKK